MRWPSTNYRDYDDAVWPKEPRQLRGEVNHRTEPTPERQSDRWQVAGGLVGLACGGVGTALAHDPWPLLLGTVAGTGIAELTLFIVRRRREPEPTA